MTRVIVSWAAADGGRHAVNPTKLPASRTMSPKRDFVCGNEVPHPPADELIIR